MIDKINHYSLTRPASVYDEEALTALELAGRTASKANECIEAFNKLESETGEKLEAQNNFIEKMNSVTMPEKVREEVDNCIKSGDFDLAINAYLDDLETRLDNILGSVSQGSTTMDAEIIDARVGEDGSTRSNLGESIRIQLENMRWRSNAISGILFNNVPEITFTPYTSLTVNIPGTTHIFYNGYRYDITDLSGSINVDENKNFTTGWELFRVYIDLNTNKLSFLWKERAPKNLVYLGYIHRDNYYFINHHFNYLMNYDVVKTPLYVPIVVTSKPTISFDVNNITVDIPKFHMFYSGKRIDSTPTTLTVPNDGRLFGIYYNLVTNELETKPTGGEIHHYADNHRVMVGVVYKQGVFMFDVHDKQTDYLKRGTLLMSGYGNVVKIDTITKTVTFPRDTLVMYHNGFDLVGGDITKDHVVSYENVSSSAICFYMSRTTKKITAKIYHTQPTTDDVLIFTFRTSSGIADLSVPYTVNGKLFNLIPLNGSGDVDVNTIPSPTPFYKGVAHRGLMSVAPENTMSAYKAAKEAGFRYMESDVVFTSDGVAVMLHDDTIDRTSNASGVIANLTFDYVRTLDFGSWYDAKFAGEKIPTFTEFIRFCRNSGIHPYIELKSGITASRVAELVQTVHHYGMRGNVTWVCFNAEWLGWVKNNDKGARLGFTQDTLTPACIQTALNLRTDFNEVFLPYGTATTEGITAAREHSFPVEVWTLNTLESIQNLPDYVSGVTSNTLDASRVLEE